jgi:hypothetical protein
MVDEFLKIDPLAGKMLKSASTWDGPTRASL